MLTLEIDCPRDTGQLRPAAERLARTFPDLELVLAAAAQTDDSAGPCVAVSAPRWRNPAFDLRSLDAEAAELATEGGALRLRVVDDGDSAEACATAALQVVTRYQRFLAGRNRESATPLFDRVLAAHRALHDLTKPLVAADYAHALDTWRWLLRLDPSAALAVQVAALFHDIERLASESDERIEQHAPDYHAFKRAHAHAGARLTAATLEGLGAAEAVRGQVATLVAGHEQAGGDRDGQALNDADALSFFSLNSCGFLAYYGPAHTRKKVAYTLNRLSVAGFRELAGVRLSADIAALVDQALSGAASAEGGLA